MIPYIISKLTHANTIMRKNETRHDTIYHIQRQKREWLLSGFRLRSTRPTSFSMDRPLPVIVAVEMSFWHWHPYAACFVCHFLLKITVSTDDTHYNMFFFQILKNP